MVSAGGSTGMLLQQHTSHIDDKLSQGSSEPACLKASALALATARSARLSFNSCAREAACSEVIGF